MTNRGRKACGDDDRTVRSVAQYGRLGTYDDAARAKEGGVRRGYYDATIPIDMRSNTGGLTRASRFAIRTVMAPQPPSTTRHMSGLCVSALHQAQGPSK